MQAALWFPIKGAKEFARKRSAPPEFRKLMRDYEAGKAPLRDFLREAKRLVALDVPVGAWEDTIASPIVADQIGKLKPILGKAAPEIADSAHLHYPGKGKRLSAKGVTPVERAIGAVTPKGTISRAAEAESQAPTLTMRLSDEALDDLGFDADARQFRSISDIPHEIQDDVILVPGGNIDTLRRLASHIASLEPP